MVCLPDFLAYFLDCGHPSHAHGCRRNAISVFFGMTVHHKRSTEAISIPPSIQLRVTVVALSNGMWHRTWNKQAHFPLHSGLPRQSNTFTTAPQILLFIESTLMVTSVLPQRPEHRKERPHETDYAMVLVSVSKVESRHAGKTPQFNESHPSRSRVWP